MFVSNNTSLLLSVLEENQPQSSSTAMCQKIAVLTVHVCKRGDKGLKHRIWSGAHKNMQT